MTMEIAILVMVFLWGGILGSFYNVVGLRIPAGESIVSPPSSCKDCGHRLGLLDLIPILGYVIRRGQCHYCGSRISPIYWFGEWLTGICFLLAYMVFGFVPEFWIAIFIISMLAILSVSDLKYRLLPNKIIFPSMLIILLLRIWHQPLPLWDYLLGFLVGGGVLLLISYGAIWTGRAPMGGGDIKLMSLLGLAFGVQSILLTLFFSAVLASVIGIVLISIGKMDRKSFIPYGPFIAIGGMIAYLYGQDMMSWYMGIISFNS